MKTKQALDREGYKSMTKIKKHYARLEPVYDKYRINCPSEVFNLNKLGLSI